MPPMAITATSALVVGIPGCRTPFAALAPVFFSPPEPGSVILWRLVPSPSTGEGGGTLTVPPSRRRVAGEGAPSSSWRALSPARGERKKDTCSGGRWCDNPGDWCNRFYWGQCRTRLARYWRGSAGADAALGVTRAISRVYLSRRPTAMCGTSPRCGRHCRGVTPSTT